MSSQYKSDQVEGQCLVVVDKIEKEVRVVVFREVGAVRCTSDTQTDTQNSHKSLCQIGREVLRLRRYTIAVNRHFRTRTGHDKVV